MSRRAIRYLGKKAGLYPTVALTFVILTTGLALWAALTRLTVEMDVKALLPKDSAVYRDTTRADFLFGLGNYDFLLCVLEIREDAPEEITRAPGRFLRSIRVEVEEALDDQRFFRRRSTRLQARRELAALQQSDAALVALLTSEDFGRYEEMVSPIGLPDALDDIASRLRDNPTSETLLLLQQDPFGLEEMLTTRSIFASGPLKQSYRDGAYISEDEEMMLLVLWPLSTSTNLMDARELMRFVTATRDALYDRNPSWVNAVDIAFSGPHVESAEGASDVREDILLTSLVSLVAVLLLFVVAFRQPEALLLVAIPLIVGVIWTLGLTSLFVHRITQVTLIFAAILIGLGIDFSIHLYNRFLENIRLGKEPQMALGAAIMNTGPSIVAGAITTGFAFFGMALTKFQGFRELGLFGGVGIIMSLLAVTVALPPLMLMFSRSARRSRTPLATLGLKKVTFTVQSYPRLTVGAGMCVVVFLGMQALQVRFNEDFQALRQPSDSYKALQARIQRHFELPVNQILVFVEGRDLDEALEENDQVYASLESLSVLYGIVGIDSLRNTYPSARTQFEALERFVGVTERRILDQIRQSAAERQIIPPDFFQPFFDRLLEIRDQCLAAINQSEAPIEITRIDSTEFLDVIRAYIAFDPDRRMYQIVTRIYPPTTPVWQEGLPPLFMERIEEGLRQQPIVLGDPVLSAELQHILIRDLTIIFLVVFFSVTIYLTFHFGSFARAGLSMIPIIFALLCMLGVMNLMGMELNYLNIIAIPMIVGIGVDSGIHLLARFYEEGRHDMRLAIEKTGRAVVITALTTIFGFGALSVASFRGIREIGLLSIIGTVCTLFAALVLLPAILKLLDPRYTYTGGPGDEIG